jgi:hypothetical protein
MTDEANDTTAEAAAEETPDLELTDDGEFLDHHAMLAAAAKAAGMPAPKPDPATEPEPEPDEPGEADAAPPQDAGEPPPPDEEEKAPELDVRLATAHEELARKESAWRTERLEMKQRLTDLERRLEQTVEPNKDNPLETFAKIMGVDPYRAVEMLNHQVATGKVSKPDPNEAQQRELQELRDRIKSFEESSAAAAREAEENELYGGILDMIGSMDGDDPAYPTIRAVGAEAAAQIAFDEIVRQYDASGGEDVPQAADILNRLEATYRADLKRVVNDPTMRRLLELAAEQQPTPTPEAGRGEQPPTKTLQNTHETQTSHAEPEEEYWQDEDEMMRRAIRAASKG